MERGKATGGGAGLSGARQDAGWAEWRAQDTTSRFRPPERKTTVQDVYAEAEKN